MIYTPKEMKAYLDEHVLGQEDAKKKAAVLVYAHLKFHAATNMIFIGPSGCGKTEIFRVLRRMYAGQRLIYIHDVANVTNDGWSGSKKASSVFKQMAMEGWSREEIEHAIIVMDEFDKMVSPKYNSNHENVAKSIQGEFLSMLEGTAVTIKNEDGGTTVINTENISFIGVGAFEDLRAQKIKESKEASNPFGFSDTMQDFVTPEIKPRDLREFGVTKEVLGRMFRLATLNALSGDDFYTILMDPQMSPISKYARMFDCYIDVDNGYMRKIAQEAVDEELGVRYMNGRIFDAISDELFEPGSSKVLTMTPMHEEQPETVGIQFADTAFDDDQEESGWEFE